MRPKTGPCRLQALYALVPPLRYRYGPTISAAGSLSEAAGTGSGPRSTASSLGLGLRLHRPTDVTAGVIIL